MCVEPFIKSVTAFIFITLFLSTAQAEKIENYFDTETYKCSNIDYQSHLSISGDTDDDITVSVFYKRLKQNRYAKAEWKLSYDSLKDSIQVEDKKTRIKYAFRDFLTDTPKVIPLDRKGNPIKGCTIPLKKAAIPTERYDAFLKFLSIENPTPDDAQQYYRDLPTLPPVEMLPTLSQASLKTSIKTGKTAFWNNYKNSVDTRSNDIKDFGLLKNVAGAWLSLNDNSRRKWHTDLLLNAQNNRANALFAKDANPSDIRLKGSQELCQRIDGFKKSWPWKTYLELATGLPLKFWNEAIAEEFLSSAESCKNGANFSQTVSKSWPKITAQMDGFKQLTTERDRLAGLEIDLDTVHKENWLRVNNEFLKKLRKTGFSQKEILNFLNPVLEKHQTLAKQSLPEELADHALKQNLKLADFAKYCSQRKREFGYVYNSRLQIAIFESCEQKLATQFTDAAQKAIQARQNTLLATTGTSADLLNTKGYNFDNIIPLFYSNSAFFTEAIKTIDTELTNAKSKTEPLYQTAITSTISEIQNAFVNAKPLTESDRQANALCTDFTKYRSNNRLRPISKKCGELIRTMKTRRIEAKCDQLWTKLDVPNELQNGSIEIPQAFSGTRQITIRNLLCGAARNDVDLSIKKDRGFFSTNYRLVRGARINGETIKFSVRLNKPSKAGGNWTANKAKMSPKLFDAKKFTKSIDLMSCIYSPDACIKK